MMTTLKLISRNDLKKAHPKLNAFLSKMLSRLFLYQNVFTDLLQLTPIQIIDSKTSNAFTNGYEVFFTIGFLEEAYQYPAGIKFPQSEHFLMFVLYHELGHILFNHVQRQKSYDPEIWNIACDYMVNSFVCTILNITGMDYTKYATGYKLFLSDRFRYQYTTTELIYEKLAKKRDIGTARAKNLMAPYVPNSNHKNSLLEIIDKWTDSDSLILEEWKSIDLGNKRTWELLLKNHLTKTLDTNGMVRNKRFPDYFIPKPLGYGINNIFIAVDVSASISKELLQTFFKAITDLLLDDVYLDLLVFNHDVKHYAIDRNNVKQVFNEIKIGGGTNLQGPLNYLTTHSELSPTILIYFTDGDAPPVTKSSVPILWILFNTNNPNLEFENKNVGTVIYYD